PTTSSATSRCAAPASASWSRRCPASSCAEAGDDAHGSFRSALDAPSPWRGEAEAAFPLRASEAREAMRLSRAERSRLVDWWFTVDRVLLAAVLVIIGAGLVLSLAASPAIALKRGLPTFYFVERHAAFALASVVIVVAASLLSPPAVRRLSLVVLAVALALMVLVLVVGAEINGARRWLHVAGYSLQPSEFAKPAF